MKVQNITVNEIYTYKELCNLLEVEYASATNKKVEQLEEFERFFKFERPVIDTSIAEAKEFSLNEFAISCIISYIEN